MDVQSVNDVTSLNFAIQTGILLFLFALTLTDISTIYFEVSSVPEVIAISENEKCFFAWHCL